MIHEKFLSEDFFTATVSENFPASTNQTTKLFKQYSVLSTMMAVTESSSITKIFTKAADQGCEPAVNEVNKLD